MCVCVCACVCACVCVCVGRVYVHLFAFVFCLFVWGRDQGPNLQSKTLVSKGPVDFISILESEFRG